MAPKAIKLPKPSSLEFRVLEMVQAEPGIVATEVARRLRPETDPVFGHQRPTSAAVVRLRKKGLLADVTVRCRTCDRALTRGHKNVPLVLNATAIQLLEAAR